VLAIAGDFDPDDAMRLVRRYFGSAKRQPKIPDHSPPPQPEQTAPREADVDDTNAKTGGMYFGWTIPANRAPEHYALEFAAILLGDGESSRLHRRLVRETEKARSAAAWTADHRGPDVFGVRVILTERGKFEDAARVVDQELSDLARRGPSANEMEKARSRLASHFVFGVQSNLDRSVRLGAYECFYGDARLLTRELPKYFAVTSDDVKQAVQRYLTASRRSIVRIHPVAASSGTPGAPVQTEKKEKK
jgi:predicted Zn-dependent peptidase